MTRSSKNPGKALAVSLAALLLGACAGTPQPKPDRPADKPVASSTKPTTPTKPAAPSAPVVVPKDPGEQFELALANMKAKKFAEAREGFANLSKEHPEFAGPLTNLGILDAKSNPTNAIGSFTRAVAVNPRNAVAYNWLGILNREAKNYPRAEDSYLKALALTPDNAGIVLNLAILYDVYLKRPEDALTRYREYQRMTGNRELKVTAWIKALETAGVGASPALPAVPAAPASTKPAAVAPKKKS